VGVRILEPPKRGGEHAEEAIGCPHTYGPSERHEMSAVGVQLGVEVGRVVAVVQTRADLGQAAEGRRPDDVARYCQQVVDGELLQGGVRRVLSAGLRLQLRETGKP
jgi:hypothetical protein